MSAGSSKIFEKRVSIRVADVVEEVQDWENHVLLRLPEQMSTEVRQWLDKDGPDAASGSKDDLLAISFAQDMRNASIKFRNQIYPAKLYDLPCIAEVTKTIDKKNVYKVADISQMLLCTTEAEKNDADEKRQENPESNPPASSKQQKKEKQYQWPHGLTPPMKSVRKRRWRKTKKKKYMDAPEVEKELKRLLRADLEASAVRWEVVTPDEERSTKLGSRRANNNELSLLPPPEIMPDNVEPDPIVIHETHQVLGLTISSSSSSDDDNSGADNDEDDVMTKALDAASI